MFEYDNDGDFTSCPHGNRYADCHECDEYIDSQGGIDKCMNCGSYKYGKQLNKYQCCAKGCRNPNEH